MTSLDQGVSTSPAVTAEVAIWLRIEGLSVAVISALLYATTGASWWIFSTVWLLPDLSMLAYLAGPRWGARGYNLAHAYVLPSLLAGVALVAHLPALLPYALVWGNHIAVDRLMGYGLKYPRGFGYTHLGTLGKPKNPRPSEAAKPF